MFTKSVYSVLLKLLVNLLSLANPTFHLHLAVLKINQRIMAYSLELSCFVLTSRMLGTMYYEATFLQVQSITTRNLQLKSRTSCQKMCCCTPAFGWDCKKKNRDWVAPDKILIYFPSWTSISMNMTDGYWRIWPDSLDGCGRWISSLFCPSREEPNRIDWPPTGTLRILFYSDTDKYWSGSADAWYYESHFRRWEI